MKNLLIVDGNSILNRAFYGVHTLTAPDGLNTNAVFGTVNILKKHLDALKPDYAAVAFDMRAKTFRHNACDFYKAKRKPMPEELAEQLPYAKECLSYIGFNILELEGYEADDILGTVSRLAADDVHAYILTGDRDSLQLIRDNVSVILVKNKEDILYGEDTFFNDYGVSPTQYIDVKSVMGDSSDNIPGIAGIGEKGAFKLIKDFGSLDNLYQNYESADLSPSLKEKIRAGKEMAFVSKFLATIVCDAPLNKSLDDLTYKGIDNDNLFRLFTRLSFASLIKKFGLVAVPSQTGNATFNVGMDGKDTASSEDEKAKYATTGIVKEGKTVLSDYGKAENETTGATENGKGIDFHEGEEKLYDIEEAEYKPDMLLSPENDICAVYFYENTVQVCNKKYEFTCSTDDICEFLKTGKIICHDCKALYKNFDLNCFFDTMLAAYVLSPSDSSYNLSDLCNKYLNCDFDEKHAALYIFKLYKALEKELEKTEMLSVLDDIEIPLAKVLAKMETSGFKVDTEGLKSYSEQLSETANACKERIYMFAGEEFNINSPKQLGIILFEKLGLKHGKMKKTGYSTNAEILEELSSEHEIIGEILAYRQVMKLNSTYCEGLLKVADGNGRIHTTFNQTVTQTGRLSSTEPNLQNIPIRTELGKQLRKYFIPKNDEYVLIDADYSQIELKVLAHLSQDANMIYAFNHGIDIHTMTASQVFGIAPEDVTTEMRKRAKAVNFGIVYGIGEFSLAKDLGISRSEAKNYINSYFATYPNIRSYINSLVDSAKNLGYAKTVSGRRRYIPELSASNKNVQAFGTRVAMNSPIQGTAADIIKIAMINVDRALEKEKIDAKLILQVHDELILESHISCVEKAKEILKTEMENAFSLSVPLTAETTVGKNWLDAK